MPPQRFEDLNFPVFPRQVLVRRRLREGFAPSVECLQPNPDRFRLLLSRGSSNRFAIPNSCRSHSEFTCEVVSARAIELGTELTFVLLRTYPRWTCDPRAIKP